MTEGEKTGKKRIFLSYSSKDVTLVKHLAGYLEKRGLAAWYAPRNIPPGSDWPRAIPPAIETCMAFVLLFSKKADESKNVLKELTLAHKYEKPVFWLRLEDIEPKDLTYFLSDNQWLDWLDKRDEALEELVNSILSLDAVDASGDESSDDEFTDDLVNLPDGGGGPYAEAEEDMDEPYEPEEQEPKRGGLFIGFVAVLCLAAAGFGVKLYFDRKGQDWEARHAAARQEQQARWAREEQERVRRAEEERSQREQAPQQAREADEGRAQWERDAEQQARQAREEQAEREREARQAEQERRRQEAQEREQREAQDEPDIRPLSGAEYREMLKDGDFAAADRALNDVWGRLKRSLPKASFTALDEEENQWIKTGRDAEAARLMESGLSRVEAYAEATRSRTEELSGLLARHQEGGVAPSAEEPPSEGPSGELTIIGDKVNLRAEPTPRARVLRELDDGDLVTLLRRNADGKWAEVRASDGTVGWIFGDRQIQNWDAAKRGNSDNGSLKSPGGANAAIRGNRVNIRQGPSLKAQVLLQLNDGAPVETTGKTVTADGGEWFQIITPSGKTGWVFGRYIRY